MQSYVNLNKQLLGRQLMGALAILALGMSFGCSGDDGPTDPDQTPPAALALVSVTPADAADAVALGVSVIAVFNKALRSYLWVLDDAGGRAETCITAATPLRQGLGRLCH